MARTIETRNIGDNIALTDAQHSAMEKLGAKHGYEIIFRGRFGYIFTELGVWRVCGTEQGLGLKHHNFLRGNAAADNHRVFNSGDYHYQRDRRDFTDIQEIFDYIIRHDKSKALEEKGIEHMPAYTRKQRKWKRDAILRQRRRDLHKLYQLFDQI